MEDKRSKRKLTFSDIDLSRWKEYEDVITDSLWILKSRQSTNGHVFDYHGNFIPQIANQVFTRYTKEDEIVVDWFLGSGTSAIEAANLNRRLIGVELKAELIKHVESKLPSELLGDRIRLIQGDSASPETYEKVKTTLVDMGAGSSHLAVLHPPYADIIKFSDMQTDLSNCPSTNAFIESFKLVASNAYNTLAPGRFAILVIGDKYCAGELDPLGFKCMQAMNEVGFKTKSIVVKNIEGNEKAKGKDNNLWRYRALAGGFYIFKHEYVMVFFK
ncbi:MAG: site-specific DNA-methyltransferase [Armatimonadetes bacterium]|nr:site-specific DNA-methyltransferase [Armatimonadota bacterium]